MKKQKLVVLVLVGLIGCTSLFAALYPRTVAIYLNQAPKPETVAPMKPISESLPAPNTGKIASYHASTSAGAGASVGTSGKLPSQILNLANWKLTLPTNGTSSPAGCNAIEILPSTLASYSVDPWFHADAAGDGIVLRSNVEGCTTSGSSYPRSELREMASSSAEANWSTTTGTHTMTLTEAVTHLPSVKPQTVFAQIHGSSDDVFEAEAIGQSNGTAKLYVNHNGTLWGSDLDDNYVLGTRFSLKVVAGGGFIDIYYNGVQKVHQAIASSGDYFKAGAYTQSNLSKGDAPGAYSEVVIYSLNVVHS